MEQYIPKSALVAEIKKRIKANEVCQKICGGHEFYRGAIDEAEEIISLIDALEVKEVDLEKEIDDYVNMHFSECDDGVLLSDANSMELTLLDITPLAKHFLNLGMAVSNKAQKGE